MPDSTIRYSNGIHQPAQFFVKLFVIHRFYFCLTVYSFITEKVEKRLSMENWSQPAGINNKAHKRIKRGNKYLISHMGFMIPNRIETTSRSTPNRYKTIYFNKPNTNSIPPKN